MTGWFVGEKENIEVALEECLCPGAPHKDGDKIYLRPDLDVAGGLAVLSAMTAGDDTSLIERMGRAYMMAGIVDWTFLDDKGEKVPATRANIERMRWTGSTLTIANAAADVYGETVLAPLARMASDSSPSGPSDESTSPSLPPSS